MTGSYLADAWSPRISSDPGFYQTVVQHKILTGQDANGAQPDGTITVYFGNPWAYGDVVGNDQYDFQSTALHELVHTLGFGTDINGAGENTQTNWDIFDTFLVTSDGSHPIDPGTDTWNSAYDANLTGGNSGLYFGGPSARAAYGGKRYRCSRPTCLNRARPSRIWMTRPSPAPTRS